MNPVTRWVAVTPPVPPVKPTRAVFAPTPEAMLTPVNVWLNE